MSNQVTISLEKYDILKKCEESVTKRKVLIVNSYGNSEYCYIPDDTKVFKVLNDQNTSLKEKVISLEKKISDFSIPKNVHNYCGVCQKQCNCLCNCHKKWYQFWK